MNRGILLILLCCPAVTACPELLMETHITLGALEIRLAGIEAPFPTILSVSGQNGTVLYRTLLSNDSISFTRPAEGIYLLSAEVLSPCRPSVTRELPIGPLPEVQYRSSTYRLWPLSLVLLATVSSTLCILLILRR